MAPQGGIMLGTSRLVTAKGTQFEFLRIAPEGDGLALLASPGGKPPVAFALVERRGPRGGSGLRQDDGRSRPRRVQAFLSDEAGFVSAATARGKDAVAAQWKRYFDGPEAPFSWQRETVEVLDSGTLALSTGPVFDPAGKLVSRFTSIWRREAPGAWRIVFDRGQAVCEEKTE